MPEPIESLVSLGLTALEAEIYAYLIRTRNQTGYGLAKALGRATANVYKAIESLEKKGAVIVDDGEQRLYNAVPAEDFLQQLERAFFRQRVAAKEALDTPPQATGDARIYQLRSRDQVYERARGMLADAKRIAVVDIFPLPWAELSEDLERAAKRGIQVVAKVYENANIAGMDIVAESEGRRVLQRWPCQWLNVNVDGSQILLAMFTRDGETVAQAIWSESPYLSWIEYDRMACELAYTKLKSVILAGDMEKVRDAYKHGRRFFVLEAPGYERLVAQLRNSSSDVDHQGG